MRYACPVHGSKPLQQGPQMCRIWDDEKRVHCSEAMARVPDPIVSVLANGEIHTATRGAGLSQVDLGTLVQASCAQPGGALGKKKNERHMKMLRAPLALRVVEAITAAGFRPGEIVTFYGPGDTFIVCAHAEKGWL